MKIRTGFVANSSSSSFIIAFDEEITVELLMKILDKDVYVYDYDEDKSYSKEDIANRIYKEASRLDVENPTKDNRGFDFNNYIESYTFAGDIFKNYWDLSDEEQEKCNKYTSELDTNKAIIKWKEAKDQTKGKFVYVASFADDDGSGNGILTHQLQDILPRECVYVIKKRQ